MTEALMIWIEEYSKNSFLGKFLDPEEMAALTIFISCVATKTGRGMMKNVWEKLERPIGLSKWRWLAVILLPSTLLQIESISDAYQYLGLMVVAFISVAALALTGSAVRQRIQDPQKNGVRLSSFARLIRPILITVGIITIAVCMIMLWHWWDAIAGLFSITASAVPEEGDATHWWRRKYLIDKLEQIVHGNTEWGILALIVGTLVALIFLANTIPLLWFWKARWYKTVRRVAAAAILGYGLSIGWGAFSDDLTQWMKPKWESLTTTPPLPEQPPVRVKNLSESQVSYRKVETSNSWQEISLGINCAQWYPYPPGNVELEYLRNGVWSRERGASDAIRIRSPEASSTYWLILTRSDWERRCPTVELEFRP